MSNSNLNLHIQQFKIKNNKANIVIVHGLHEHSGRYAHVIAALNEAGLGVYTFDLRGHGQSDGVKNFISDIDEYRQDMENVLRQVPTDKPLYLLGHSMGGLIVMNYMLYRDRADISGVILSGPALEIGDDVSPMAIKILGVVGKYLPQLKTVKVKPSQISRDFNEVEKYKNDPLNSLHGTKAGLGIALLTAIQELKPKFPQFTHPILIMHGGADTITNPEGSRLLSETCESKDKTLKIWEDAYHEIFNEINKDEVIEYMLDWIKARIS
jgi:alpha-beta hydrolase superfamily lysophospholipase